MRACYRKRIVGGAASLCLAMAGQAAMARAAVGGDDDMGAGALSAPDTPGHLECVPYARTTSGIRIYGDAHTWWDKASGRYATGHTPRVGAVMAIRPHNNSRLGHVATVSRIVDSRTLLLSHANWSAPGEIERNVTALDVSPDNDWSQVRIWYAPIRALGTTHWPVSGFIYNAKPRARTLVEASFAEPHARKPSLVTAPTAQKSPSAKNRKSRRSDPIGAIITGGY